MLLNGTVVVIKIFDLFILQFFLVCITVDAKLHVVAEEFCLKEGGE
jgi:hypothetical protein